MIVESCIIAMAIIVAGYYVGKRTLNINIHNHPIRDREKEASDVEEWTTKV